MMGIKDVEDSRIRDVERHVEKLFGDMVTEEERNLDRITKNIQRYEMERLEIRKDLRVFVETDDSFEAALSLIDVEFK